MRWFNRKASPEKIIDIALIDKADTVGLHTIHRIHWKYVQFATATQAHTDEYLI